MAIKCKVERLLTGVRAIVKEHYERDYYRYGSHLYNLDEEFSGKDFIAKRQAEHQVNIKKESEAAMQIITTSETSPVALEYQDFFRVLESSLWSNLDKYKYIDFRIFLFRDSIYAASGPYTEAECMLLVAELADKERKLFEALSQKQDSPEVREALSDRRRIPEKVRIAVWRRDQGQCARCSSRLNLEYDHIIPVAEGGSNTVRNIELLCEKCNRSKGKKIQ